jgi:hypothetical protein
LVTNFGAHFPFGDDGGLIRATELCRRMPGGRHMSAAAPLQLMIFFAIAGISAICGSIASAVILRRKKRVRGYFLLGVLTGLTAAAITRGRYRQLSALTALARGFWRPQRTRMRRVRL